MIIKDKIIDGEEKTMENESNLNSLQSYQENILNAMGVLENFYKETTNNTVKNHLKVITDDLSALFDYCSKQACVSEESFTTISNYISAALDLLNLKKAFRGLSTKVVSWSLLCWPLRPVIFFSW